MTDKLIKESEIDCLETIDSKLVPYGDCYGRGCINCKDIHSLIKKEQEGEDWWDTDWGFLSDNLDKLNKKRKMETLGSKSKNLIILVLDKPGHGNASHEYRIVKKQEKEDAEIFASISFQNGPIKENGVNGCTQENLLEIVLHRLDSFQSGDFGCSENTIAYIHVQEALKSLNRRTIARQARGVEGKTIK